MIAARIDARVFPDRLAEQSQRIRRRVLSRFGYLVRAAAQASIQPDENTSRPGQPPASHTGRLRRGILYAVDSQAESVIIGPRKYERHSTQGSLRALEEGGETQIRRRATRFRPRPFMRPAFAAAVDELPRILQRKTS